MKLSITLRDGEKYELVGIDDVEAWMDKFVGRGTSQLGDWLETVPNQGDARAFVRASDVVSVRLIDDDEADSLA